MLNYFEVINIIVDNVGFLMDHAPNLQIRNTNFGMRSLQEIITIVREWETNLNLTSQFMANPGQVPSPILTQHILEFQDVRGLNDWSNLSL